MCIATQCIYHFYKCHIFLVYLILPVERALLVPEYLIPQYILEIHVL